MITAHEQNAQLFKLAVLAVLIIIFIAVATIKIWELRIAAERVGVAHTIGSLQSSLGMQLGKLVVNRGMDAVMEMEYSNPMQLLQPPPGNYLGEFSTTEAPQEQGGWYFDSDERVLVYRVRFAESFLSSNDELPDLARYQLRLDYQDFNGNNRFDPELEFARGLYIQPVDSYTWIREP